MGSAGGSGGSAGGNSLLSLGLGAASTMMQAGGTADANNYQADRLEVAAQYGDVKAVQTSTSMTRSLNTTLGNIDAVRAAAHADPTSPTGAAFRDNQETLGIDQKTTAVFNINAQNRQMRDDAAYYRSAASNALTMGYINAGVGLAKGIAGMGMPGGG